MSKTLETDAEEGSLIGDSDRFQCHADEDFCDPNDSEVMKELDDMSRIDQLRNRKTDTDRIIQGRYFTYSILKKILGVGAYSIVYGGLVESGSDNDLPAHIQIELGQDIAIKKIDISKMTDEDILFVKNEEDICRAIMHHRCENIVQIYDVIRTNSNVYIVMEVLTGSTLSSVLIKPMKESYIRYYLSQIVNSLIYLRNRHIVHGDVKPGNVLMSSDHKTLKLCDFGFSTVINTDIDSDDNEVDSSYEITEQIVYSDFEALGALDEQSNHAEDPNTEHKRIIICGSPIYMAPEIRRIEYSPDYKIDIWALGMVLHEMIFGFHPFRGIKDTRSIANAIPNLQISRTKHIATKSKGITLLRSMLDTDSNSRFDIEDVAGSNWLISVTKTDKTHSTTRPIQVPNIVTPKEILSDSSDTSSDLQRSSESDNSTDYIQSIENQILPNFQSTIQKKFKRTRNRLKLSDLFYTPRVINRPNVSGSCPGSFTAKRSSKTSKKKHVLPTEDNTKSFSISGTEVAYKKVPIESILFGNFFG
jgi:serine/threonine protein kinase